MKFIDEDIFTLLKKTKLPVQKITANYLDEDRDSYNFIMYSIPQNITEVKADNKEIISSITLNLEIFSEAFDTDKTAEKINELLAEKYDWIERIDLTDEVNYGKYNKRDLAYIIYC